MTRRRPRRTAAGGVCVSVLVVGYHVMSYWVDSSSSNAVDGKRLVNVTTDTHTASHTAPTLHHTAQQKGTCMRETAIRAVRVTHNHHLTISGERVLCACVCVVD